jgi:hypothetical protein
LKVDLKNLRPANGFEAFKIVHPPQTIQFDRPLAFKLRATLKGFTGFHGPWAALATIIFQQTRNNLNCELL